METVRQLESEIEHDLQHGGLTSDQIEVKFKNIKDTLDKVDKSTTEYVDINCYYHAIYAAYLRSIGKSTEASEHDKLAGKYAEIRPQGAPMPSPQPPANNNANPTDNNVIVPFAAPIAKPDSIKQYQETASYLNYIYEKVKIITDKLQKANLYKDLALFYIKQAKREMTTTFLNSVPYWQYARNHFLDSLKFNDKDVDCVIGYAKCLIKLAKYDDALAHLKDKKYLRDEIINRVDYCLTRAKAHRYRFEYNEAEKYLKQAYAALPNDNKIFNDLRLVQDIIKNKTEDKLNEFKSTKLVYDCNFYTKRNDNEADTYRILSVDGGGIRGIIPAYWLCEIEKRAHKPIAHLFNLLAGTSTGGIISAGLTVPKNDDGYTPMYRAYDLLDIYLHRGQDLFTYRNFLHLNIGGSRYSDIGRYKMFQEYFGNKTLKESLTNVVVPACNEENLISTYIFNRYDACIDPFRNDTYVDALMATSAAPTYFPTYKIQGKGLFNDGGVHANNPSSLACSEALRYGVDKNKLLVLSLGTGGCIPDPIGYGTSRNILFWASHLQDVALQAQVGNADIAIGNALGDTRYQRWQAWLENPITLDDYKPESLNILMENAKIHIEKLDHSERNSLNKLIEKLVDE